MYYYDGNTNTFISCEEPFSFIKGKFRVSKWSNKENRVIVTGCNDCRECCGPSAGYQPLYLLPDQNADLYRYKGTKCIHPAHGCKQLDTTKGCKLNGSTDKPILCNIYPFRLAGKRLVAHSACPAVQNTPLVKLQQVGAKVLNYLITLPVEFLFTVSEESFYYSLVDLFLEIKH